MSGFVQVSADDYRECLYHQAQVVETRLGPIEYAVRGEGPTLLSVHGGPGGYDQGLALAECFRKNGFRIVAPSRPGYLNTPLGQATSPEGQADALAALVEALDLGRVAVVGASAGGPPTYTLAQKHPEKVTALVEIDSVCLKYTKLDEISKSQQALYLSRPGLWLMDWFMRHFPSTVVKSFLKTESSLEGHELDDRVKEVVKDPIKLSFVRVITKTFCSNYEGRQAGVENDVAILEAIDELPVDRIQCPTLIMHGNADSDVPPKHARYAHQNISGSDLYWIEGGSHIGFWIADSALPAQEYAVNWLREKAGS